MKQPVILIGAARSGTKLVRDLLAEHPAISATPYDINYLWRIGNEPAPDDQLDAPLPRRAVELVSAQLDKAPTNLVVEKTVSNCLRVPAIAAAFPNAEFVFLIRDGFDVTESAMRQWVAPTDWKYTVKKALQYPWLAAPTYAIDHLRGMLTRSRAESPQWWGPRYPGIEIDIQAQPLHIVCARQWAECNRLAVEGFAAVGVRPHRVRYEELANDPIRAVNGILSHLGQADVGSLTTRVTTKSIGQGRATLSAQELDEIDEIVTATTRMLDQ